VPFVAVPDSRFPGFPAIPRFRDSDSIDAALTVLAAPYSRILRLAKTGRLRVPRELREAWAEHGKHDVCPTLRRGKETGGRVPAWRAGDPPRFMALFVSLAEARYRIGPIVKWHCGCGSCKLCGQLRGGSDRNAPLDPSPSR